MWSVAGWCSVLSAISSLNLETGEEPDAYLVERVVNQIDTAIEEYGGTAGELSRRSMLLHTKRLPRSID